MYGSCNRLRQRIIEHSWAWWVCGGCQWVDLLCQALVRNSGTFWIGKGMNDSCQCSQKLSSRHVAGISTRYSSCVWFVLFLMPPIRSKTRIHTPDQILSACSNLKVIDVSSSCAVIDSPTAWLRCWPQWACWQQRPSAVCTACFSSGFHLQAWCRELGWAPMHCRHGVVIYMSDYAYSKLTDTLLCVSSTLLEKLFVTFIGIRNKTSLYANWPHIILHEDAE